MPLSTSLLDERGDMAREGSECSACSCLCRCFSFFASTESGSAEQQHRQVEAQVYQAPNQASASMSSAHYHDDGESEKLLGSKTLVESSAAVARREDAAGTGSVSGVTTEPAESSHRRTPKNRSPTWGPLAGSPPSMSTGPLGQLAEPRHQRAASNLSSKSNNPRRAKAGSSGNVSEVSGPIGKAMAPQDEDDDFCPTCLEAYTADNPKIWTGCAHHFHMPCILEWMERKDTCPYCESKMTFPGLS